MVSLFAPIKSSVTLPPREAKKKAGPLDAFVSRSVSSNTISSSNTANIARKKMEERGLAPDVVTYTSVIDAWAQQGSAEKAVALLEKMEERGLAPDVVTYTPVIEVLAKQGSAEEAAAHCEAIAIQRRGQLLLLQKPPCRLDVHGRGEELERIPTQLLGTIHRQISVLHQGSGVLTVVGNHGDADTDRDADFVIVQPDPLAQTAQDRLCHLAGGVRIADARQ